MIQVQPTEGQTEGTEGPGQARHLPIQRNLLTSLKGGLAWVYDEPCIVIFARQLIHILSMYSL